MSTCYLHIVCDNLEQNSSIVYLIFFRVRDRQRCQSFSPDYSGSSKDLSMELGVQNGIILQAAKALSYCKSCNNLYSPQYVEAEKILLVACMFLNTHTQKHFTVNV